MNENPTRHSNKLKFNIKDLVFRNKRRPLRPKRQKNNVNQKPKPKSFLHKNTEVKTIEDIPTSARTSRTTKSKKIMSRKSQPIKEIKENKDPGLFEERKPSLLRPNFEVKEPTSIINQKAKKERFKDKMKNHKKNTFKNFTTIGEINIVKKDFRLIKDKSVTLLRRSQKTLKNIKSERRLDPNDYKCITNAPMKFNLYKIKATKYRCNMALLKNKESSNKQVETLLQKLNLNKKKLGEFKDNFLRPSVCNTERKRIKMNTVNSSLFRTQETNNSEVKTIPVQIKNISLNKQNFFKKFDDGNVKKKVSIEKLQRIENIIKKHNFLLFSSLLEKRNRISPKNVKKLLKALKAK